MLNLYPYTNGHLMIAPFEHVSAIQDLEPETTADGARPRAIEIVEGRM